MVRLVEKIVLCGISLIVIVMILGLSEVIVDALIIGIIIGMVYSYILL